MTVAFVPQGGGSLTAGQVGMLSLREAGIRPDVIVGSSAGALNAVASARNNNTNFLEVTVNRPGAANVPFLQRVPYAS